MATTFVDQISGSGPAPSPVDPITGAGETVAYKAPCRLATTGNITLTGHQTVDGSITTDAEPRTLVRSQTDQSKNGIYIASSGAWQRARDFDSNRDVTKGTRVVVTGGATLAGVEFQVTTSNPIDIGTSNIVFETVTADSTALNATNKASPVNADRVFGSDSAASFGLVYYTWTQVKVFLKTYFDTLYQPLLSTLTSWGAIARASGVDTFIATPSSANLRGMLTDESGTGVALFAGTPGTNIANTPAGNIAATTVQAAINELDTEKQPLNSNLTTLAGLTATTDNFIVSVSSAWASRTVAQVLTLLASAGTTFQPLAAALTSWAGITRASGLDTFAATPSSANLRGLLTDETGTGAAVFANAPAITDPVITGTITEDVYTITDGAAFAIDPRNGSVQQVTLGASRTPVAANWVSGDSVHLKVADGTAYTITWSTIGVVWVGGSAPTLATSGFTHIVLWRDGSTYYGKYVGDTAS